MIINGTSCGVIDYLYPEEDFSGPRYAAAMSRRNGDGGLSLGKLVFAGAFEAFMGKPYEEALADLAGGKPPGSYNLGGPSVVSLAHAAQILADPDHSYRVRFFGVRGTDKTGDLIDAALARLPLESRRLLVKEGPSARTDVFSDPTYDNGPEITLFPIL